MTLVTNTAPGKLLLNGEYAVLEGYPALVCSVNRFVSCSFTPQDFFEVTTTEGPNTYSSTHSFFIKEIFAAAEEYGLKIPLGHYSLDSSAFFLAGKKLGLGSSAALCVALSKVLLSLNQREINQNTLFPLSFRAHHRAAHGLGSGVDVAAACFEGVMSYQLTKTPFKPRIHKFEQKIDEKSVIAVFTGQTQSTRDFLEVFYIFKRKHPDLHHQLILNLARANAAFSSAFNAGHIESLITAVKSVSHCLMMLGKAMKVPIITEAHHHIAAIAAHHGGAAKISGAGGGDISICVAPPSQSHKLLESLCRSGFTPLNSLFYTQGN